MCSASYYACIYFVYSGRFATTSTRTGVLALKLGVCWAHVGPS